MKTRSHIEEVRKGRNSGQETPVGERELWVQRKESTRESTWGNKFT